MSQHENDKPFRHLKRLLQDHDIRVEELPAVRLPERGRQPLSPQQEDMLFCEAMQGVTPLRGRKTVRTPPRRPPERCRLSDDQRVVNQLQELVDSGCGFHVAHTPEYIEGKSDRVADEVLRRLHGGTFSIQAYLDLHGMRVTEGRAAVDDFLRRVVRQGWRTVLIVHGRGLSSPGEPVLKSHLRRWLSRGIWRRWVLAYTSARICDGGAGATYVLLRHRPVSNRLPGNVFQPAARTRTEPRGTRIQRSTKAPARHFDGEAT